MSCLHRISSLMIVQNNKVQFNMCSSLCVPLSGLTCESGRQSEPEGEPEGEPWYCPFRWHLGLSREQRAVLTEMDEPFDVPL